MLPLDRLFLFSTLALLFLFRDALLPHVHAHPTSQTISRRNPSTDGPTMSTASWIWEADSKGAAVTSAGNVAFLRQFTAPTGQSASSAVVSMTAVDNFYLWVNGQPIGSSSPAPDQWQTAQVLTATLNSTTSNTFSVLVVNSANSAAPQPGLLAAILISFSDGTNTTIVSDANWLASTNIPMDFPTPADTSSFSTAAVAAPYGSGSWGQSVTVPTPGPTSLNLSASTWIWSTSDAKTVAPVGLVGFRRTISTPPGKSAQSATIILTVDNYFWLYLNGVFVGAPPATSSTLQTWQTAQRFNVTLNPTVNIFTLQARNDVATGTSDQTSAGLIAAIQIFYADGSNDFVPTDSSWLNSPSDYTDLPTFLNTSDNLLNNSIELGTFGIAPWTGVSIADALDAASVPQAPFSSASSPSPSPSASAGSSSHSHVMPVAAILGTILGVVVLVAISAIAFLWRRRQRRSFGNVQDAAARSQSPDALLSTSEYAVSAPVAFTAAVPLSAIAPTPCYAPPGPYPAAGAFTSSFAESSSRMLPQPTGLGHSRKAEEAAADRDLSEDDYAPPPSYSDSESTVGAMDGGSQQ